MSKRRRTKATGDAVTRKLAARLVLTTTAPRNWQGWVAVLVFAAVAALIYCAPSERTPDQLAINSRLAPRNLCKAPPPLMRNLAAEQGFGPQSALSTSERDLLGLAVVDFDLQTGKRAHAWQHPSWRIAGNLAAFALDKRGDIYVIPAPRVNLSDNPPAAQNRLYRVDGTSGVMTLALEFPVAAAVNARNPFAGLGLSYDCALDSLFLTSVAGSTPAQQKGKVFRIAVLPSAQIASSLSDIDAFGVLSVSTENSNSVELLLGSARSAEIFRVRLNAAGNFPPSAQAQPWLSFAGLGPEGNDRARKMELTADGLLTVRGTRFAYNLAQPSAQAKATSYLYAFDTGAQKYQFQRWVK